VDKQECVVVADRALELAQNIAQQRAIPFVGVELGSFSDTESIITFDQKNIPPVVGFNPKEDLILSGKSVFLVFQFSFSHKTTINDQLVRFLFLAHQIKVAGAKKIIAIVPYLPYARQCKNVTGDFVGPFEALGGFFASVKIDHVISCQLHEDMCKTKFTIPLHEITLESIWKNIRDYDNICFLSPDRGGVDRVKKIAAKFALDTQAGPGIAVVEKKRVGYDKSVALSFTGEVTNKTVVLIDDIIDTGTTAIQAAKLALEHGAKNVIACFYHVKS